MAIFSNEFKASIRNMGSKIKKSAQGAVAPWKPSKEQKLAKLEAQIKILRKEIK